MYFVTISISAGFTEKMPYPSCQEKFVYALSFGRNVYIPARATA
jgi:hypothetical protein